MRCIKCKAGEYKKRLFLYKFRGKTYAVCVDCYHEYMDSFREKNDNKTWITYLQCTKCNRKFHKEIANGVTASLANLPFGVYFTSGGKYTDMNGKKYPHAIYAKCPSCRSKSVKIISSSKTIIPDRWFLREEIANLEHEQWMSWTKAIAKLPAIPGDLIEKWRVNWIPYHRLPELVKRKDRIQAEKVLKIVEKYQEKL